MHFLRFSLEGLVHHGIHYGHHMALTDTRSYPILAGHKNRMALLDAGLAVQRLKYGLALAHSIGAKNAKVLFVNPALDSIDFMSTKIYDEYLNFSLTFRKLPGILSNYKGLSRYLSNNTGSLRPYRRSSRRKPKRRKLPSLALIFQSQDHYAVREATYLNLPYIALFDSNTNAALASFYNVPANDDSLITRKFFISIFFRALRAGFRSFLQRWFTGRNQKVKTNLLDQVEPKRNGETEETSAGSEVVFPLSERKRSRSIASRLLRRAGDIASPSFLGMASTTLSRRALSGRPNQLAALMATLARRPVVAAAHKNSILPYGRRRYLLRIILRGFRNLWTVRRSLHRKFLRVPQNARRVLLRLKKMPGLGVFSLLPRAATGFRQSLVGMSSWAMPHWHLLPEDHYRAKGDLRKYKSIRRTWYNAKARLETLLAVKKKQRARSLWAPLKLDTGPRVSKGSKVSDNREPLTKEQLLSPLLPKEEPLFLKKKRPMTLANGRLDWSTRSIVSNFFHSLPPKEDSVPAKQSGGKFHRPERPWEDKHNPGPKHTSHRGSSHQPSNSRRFPSGSQSGNYDRRASQHQNRDGRPRHSSTWAPRRSFHSGSQKQKTPMLAKQQSSFSAGDRKQNIYSKQKNDSTSQKPAVDQDVLGPKKPQTTRLPLGQAGSAQQPAKQNLAQASAAAKFAGSMQKFLDPKFVQPAPLKKESSSYPAKLPVTVKLPPLPSARELLPAVKKGLVTFSRNKFLRVGKKSKRSFRKLRTKIIKQLGPEYRRILRRFEKWANFTARRPLFRQQPRHRAEALEAARSSQLSENSVWYDHSYYGSVLSRKKSNLLIRSRIPAVTLHSGDLAGLGFKELVAFLRKQLVQQILRQDPHFDLHAFTRILSTHWFAKLYRNYPVLRRNFAEKGKETRRRLLRVMEQRYFLPNGRPEGISSYFSRARARRRLKQPYARLLGDRTFSVSGAQLRPKNREPRTKGKRSNKPIWVRHKGKYYRVLEPINRANLPIFLRTNLLIQWLMGRLVHYAKQHMTVDDFLANWDSGKELVLLPTFYLNLMLKAIATDYPSATVTNSEELQEFLKKLFVPRYAQECLVRARQASEFLGFHLKSFDQDFKPLPSVLALKNKVRRRLFRRK